MTSMNLDDPGSTGLGFVAEVGFEPTSEGLWGPAGT